MLSIDCNTLMTAY